MFFKLANAFRASFFISFFLLVACSGSSIRFDRFKDTRTPWDGFSRFLAGEKTASSNSFVTEVGAVQSSYHQKFMDQSWALLEENTRVKMGFWQEENIPEKYRHRTVFYPLSGADLINVYSLFPRSNRYILAGLEKTGDPSLVDGNQIPGTDSLIKSLVEIRSLMSFYTRYSYFTSKGMSEHMNGHKIHGVLPIFMIALSRLGMEIRTVAGAVLDENGALHSFRGKNPPVLYIRFYSPREKELKELVYFNLAISNETLSPSSPLGRFLHGEKELNVMLKSAVYLFHNPKYNEARDFILKEAGYILQDDSGIPYKILNTGAWEIQLYGVFTTPVPLSGIVPSNPVQPDLAAGYRFLANPLPFEYGYGNLRGKGKSNLLTARKK